MTSSGLGPSERSGVNRRSLPFVVAVAALLLGSLGQLCLNRPGNERAGVVLLVLAVALVGLAFRRRPHVEETGQREFRFTWGWKSVLSLLVASIPAFVGASLLAVRWASLFTGLLLYAWSLVLVCLVCARREGWSLPKLSAVRGHWAELTLVGLVLALGLFLLVYRLDYYPPPDSISWNDEAQIGKDAYGVLHHHSRPWQFPVSVYTTCLAFLSLGPTVFALRLNFVLMGFLTLLVFYLLARENFRFPVALASTFLFAVSRWHIAFSRLVLPSTPAMLLEVCTFYLLLRGNRTRGMMNYVLAGMTLGLGLYTHASFRVVPFLVLLLLVYEVGSWWRGRKAEAGDPGGRLFHGLLVRWLAFLVSFVLFTLPLVAIVRREPQVAFGERFSSVMPALFGGGSAAQTVDLVERVQRVLGFFNYQGESWGAVNLPDLPMLDPWTGVLFVLGLGCCVVYFWRGRHLFYLNWLLITVIGGGVLTVDLRSHRFAGAMPVLFLFAGVFLDRTIESFEMAFGRERRRYFAALVVPVLLLAGWANCQIFFGRQIYAERVRIEFTREVVGVANYIASLGEGHYFYLFANHPYYEPGMDFAWMAGEAPGERAIDVLDVLPSRREIEGEDVVYVISTPYDVEALVDLVRHFYPQAEVNYFEGAYDRYEFASVVVQSDEVRAGQGLLGSYYHGDTIEPRPDAERLDAQIAFDWAQEAPPVDFPFVGEWRGTVFAPHDGKYAFEMEGTGRPQLSVDGQALGDGESVKLVKGWHKIEVQHTAEEEGGSLELLWRVGEDDHELIAPQYLSPRRDVSGVLVSVFEGPDFSGEPVERSIQPSLSLLRMPTAWRSAFVRELAGQLYSLDCRGGLRIDEPGSYRLGLEVWNGEAALYIDGLRVLTTTGPASSADLELELESGWHELRVRYSYRGGEFSGMEVFWTPPGGERQAIPPAFLRPTGETATRLTRGP